jgi:hypothetical protein
MSPEKKKTRRRIPPDEQARRTQQRKQRREQSITAVEQLLFTRLQTAKALGNVSVATIQRMEARGLLDIVRIAGTPKLNKFVRWPGGERNEEI